ARAEAAQTLDEALSIMVEMVTLLDADPDWGGGDWTEDDWTEDEWTEDDGWEDDFAPIFMDEALAEAHTGPWGDHLLGRCTGWDRIALLPDELSGIPAPLWPAGFCTAQVEWWRVVGDAWRLHLAAGLGCRGWALIGRPFGGGAA
ncbi:MAG: hypothetical protein P8N02_03380, partial [Actinomycetota bacterium]|nr:hypothetical protein [Actinomycetota bacterium]